MNGAISVANKNSPLLMNGILCVLSHLPQHDLDIRGPNGARFLSLKKGTERN